MATRGGDSGVVGALMRAGVATGLGSSLGIRPIRESEDARGKVRSARAGYRSRISDPPAIELVRIHCILQYTKFNSINTGRFWDLGRTNKCDKQWGYFLAPSSG